MMMRGACTCILGHMWRYLESMIVMIITAIHNLALYQTFSVT
jgi:hypothetical protein